MQQAASSRLEATRTTAVSGSGMAATPGSRWQRVYLLGDSLTQQSFSVGGWGARLAEAYQRKFDVVNRGFSGYTSTYVEAILPRLALEDQLLLRKDVAAGVIMLGANDAVLEVDKRRVSVEQYVANMKSISACLAEASVDIHRQILVGPPPVAEDLWRAHCETLGREMNLSNDNTKLYSDALATLAKDIGVAGFLNLHSLMQAEDSWHEMLSDGLHFSPKGNEFVAEKIGALLDGVLPRVDLMYPAWDAIDPTNPNLKDV